jgi:hypothetical protein
VQGVVALQGLRALGVAGGEDPSWLAREEAQWVGFEVPSNRLGDGVVVVGECAPVLPHERQRAGLVEAV